MENDMNEIVRQNIITYMNQKNISTIDILKKKMVFVMIVFINI